MGTGKAVAKTCPTGTAASAAADRGFVVEAGQGAAALGECGAVWMELMVAIKATHVLVRGGTCVSQISLVGLQKKEVRIELFTFSPRV